jgi:transketolase
MSINGAYFIKKNAKPQITLMASGSEVSMAYEVQKILKNKNIISNLVSIPCVELFDRQSKNYKKKILGDRPRVIIEASSSFGWHKFLREDDLIFSIDRFGESGKGDELFKFFGFDPINISKKIYIRYFNDST